MSGRTILVVEDDQTFAYALDRRLREADFEVIRAAGSLEALGHLESGHRLDLLLADIHMPVGQPHGIALSMMARVRRPRLPVIFMSGYPGLIKEGRIDEPVFEKPFDLSSLVEAIRARLHSEPDAPQRPDRRA
jgi:CheY-like chemotaxis protein